MTMKPSTKSETVLLVKAWAKGELKSFIAPRMIEYHAAMMRKLRFKREYPKEYKMLTKVNSVN